MCGHNCALSSVSTVGYNMCLIISSLSTACCLFSEHLATAIASPASKFRCSGKHLSCEGPPNRIQNVPCTPSPPGLLTRSVCRPFRGAMHRSVSAATHPTPCAGSYCAAATCTAPAHRTAQAQAEPSQCLHVVAHLQHWEKPGERERAHVRGRACLPGHVGLFKSAHSLAQNASRRRSSSHTAYEMYEVAYQKL